MGNTELLYDSLGFYVQILGGYASMSQNIEGQWTGHWGFQGAPFGVSLSAGSSYAFLGDGTIIRGEEYGAGFALPSGIPGLAPSVMVDPLSGARSYSIGVTPASDFLETGYTITFSPQKDIPGFFENGILVSKNHDALSFSEASRLGNIISRPQVNDNNNFSGFYPNTSYIQKSDGSVEPRGVLFPQSDDGLKNLFNHSAIDRPLIVDLGTSINSANDGLDFLSKFSSNAFYDYDGDGFRKRTAWVGPNEGIVFLDVDGSGRPNGNEIVLSEVVSGNFRTDFEAFASFNKTSGGDDGKVTASETPSNLFIWQDSNSNGKYDSGDTVSAFDTLVTAVDVSKFKFDDLDTDGDGQIDILKTTRFADGSIIYGAYEVSLANGAGKTMAYDMAFAHDELGFKDSGGTVKLEGSVTRKIQEVTAGTPTKLGGEYYVATGLDGNDVISVDMSQTSKTHNFSVDGGKGNDTLTGGDGNDWIVGGLGADKISGGRGDDVLFVDGSDTLVSGGMGYDVVIGQGTANISIPDMGDAGIESFTGAAGADTVAAGSALNVYLSGLGGNDDLTGSSQSDTLLGGDGNDTLRGYAGDDYLVGGAGKDKIDGYSGDDVVVIDRFDQMIDTDDGSIDIKGGSGNDLLIYADNDLKNLALNLGTYGFEGAVGSKGNDTLKLKSLDAAGDNVWQTENGTLVGREGNDNLYGGKGDDIISGDAGSDTLYGGDGSDVYLYGRGGGTDAIIESTIGAGGRDTLAFGSAIDPDDIQFKLTGTDSSDLTVTIGGTDGGTVNIVGWTDIADAKQVELLSFSDGTILDIANMSVAIYGSDDTVKVYTGSTQKLVQAGTGNDDFTGGTGNDILFGQDGDDKLHGGNGNDYLNGGSNEDKLYGDSGDDRLVGLGSADTLYGGAGNDYLDGGTNVDILKGEAGDDVLIGGSGDDSSLDGGEGDDLLIGGTGSDTLVGGKGNDTYVFSRGDGRDTIQEVNNDVASNVDKLIFGSTITINDLAFDLTSGGSLVIGVVKATDSITAPSSMADKVTIFDWDHGNVVEQLVLSDGLILDVSTITNANSGGNGADDLSSSKPSILTGGNGNDSIIGGDNVDILVGGKGNDHLEGIFGKDALFGGDGDDELDGGSMDDRLFGGAGDDSIKAGSHDAAKDLLVGGTGDDKLYGYDGDDTYVFGWGDGSDTIYEGLGDDTIQLSGGVWFSDIDITGEGETDDLVLTLDGSLYGYNTHDKLRLHDQLDGGASPSAAEKIEKLQLINGLSLDVSMVHGGKIGSDEGTTITSTYSTYGYWAAGHGGNDIITTGGGNDFLIGGQNDDKLSGGAGLDTYIFGVGDGRDTIVDTEDDKNVLILGPGITHEDIALVSDDHDMVLLVKNSHFADGAISDFSEYVRIKDWSSPPHHSIETLQFADGSSIQLSDIDSGYYLGAGDANETSYSDNDQWIDAGTGNDLIHANGGDDHIYGVAGNDELYGDAGKDQIFGGAGNDNLSGGDDNDVVAGGEGSDHIYGNGGFDTLLGGAGEDTLRDYSGADIFIGGRGNDTIEWGGASTSSAKLIFAAGDGADTIEVVDGHPGAMDVVEIDGYGVHQIWFSKTNSGKNLTVSFLETEDRMVFKDFFNGSGSVSEFRADGQTLSVNALNSLINDMSGLTANDGTDSIGIVEATLTPSLLADIDAAWI